MQAGIVGLLTRVEQEFPVDGEGDVGRTLSLGAESLSKRLGYSAGSVFWKLNPEKSRDSSQRLGIDGIRFSDLEHAHGGLLAAGLGRKRRLGEALCTPRIAELTEQIWCFAGHWKGDSMP